MGIKVKAHVDLSGLKHLRKAIKESQKTSGNGPFRRCYKRWAYRFLVYLQRRFNKMSRGGWAPLKKATIRRRRGGGKGAKILVDTGTLRTALSPGMKGIPGQLNKAIPWGQRVGYGGPTSHPKAKYTIAMLAHMHNTGAGTLPKREIIVDPDQATLNGMARDAKQAIQESIE